jgi:hypothetical protein
MSSIQMTLHPYDDVARNKWTNTKMTHGTSYAQVGRQVNSDMAGVIQSTNDKLPHATNQMVPRGTFRKPKLGWVSKFVMGSAGFEPPTSHRIGKF